MGAAISIMCQIHTFGAVMFVFGYNALEALSLWKLRSKITLLEQRLRSLCVLGSSFCMSVFVFTGWLFARLEDFGICCDDIYVDAVEGVLERFNMTHSLDNTSETYEYREHMIRKTYGQKILKDSAKELGLTIKKAEFWSEEMAGVFIIVSHFLVW